PALARACTRSSTAWRRRARRCGSGSTRRATQPNGFATGWRSTRDSGPSRDPTTPRTRSARTCETGRTRPDSRNPPREGRPETRGPLFQIVPKLLRPGRMPELRQRLRFDLPDPLAGDAEFPAHLFQRPGMAVQQSEPELNDLLLPV